jgi:pimeloyl-ACP methyl ester carboxylesterase
MRLIEGTTQQLSLLRAGDFVVLLHGTFASKADWVNPDHPLPKALSETGPGIKVVPFRWSGTNSHSARLAAATSLAELVNKIGERHPNSGFHFISHSHGGNVVLLALKNSSVVAKTRSVAFLGTPFFEITPRSFFSGVRRFAQLVALFSPLLLLLSPLLIIGSLLEFAAWLLIGGLSLWFYLSRGMPYFENFLFQRISKLLAAKQEWSLNWLKTAIPTQPVFIATTSADEARLWLQILNSVSAIPHRIWKFLYWSLPPLLVLGLVIDTLGDAYLGLAAFTGLDISYEKIPIIIFGGISFIAFLSIFIPLLSVIIGIIIRGSFLAFGWEGLFTPLIFSIVPVQSPPWPLPPGSRKILTPARGVGLRHSSFYSDTTTISDLCEWLVGIEPSEPKSAVL